MKKLLLCLTLIFLANYINYAQVKSNKALEAELLKLKNQAFCDCYDEVISGKEKTPYKDGSTYVHIMNLKGEYVFRNEKYYKMIKDWAKKEYKSYDPENNLYLMQCLDFYNSAVLKKFIDSVRLNEIRLEKIK
jgi:hypothetical protein